MSDKLGFIPLQDQVRLVKDDRNTSIVDVLESHRIVSKSGTL